MLTSGQQEELNYHKKKYSQVDNDGKKIRNPETWENRSYKRTLIEDFELKPDTFVGKSVLDIGGGPLSGLHFWPFLESSRRVVLDPLAKEFGELLKGYKNISSDVETIAGYAEDMPFTDGSLDMVLTFNSLDHWNDWKKGTDEVIRILKHNGVFLLYVNLYRPAKTVAHPHYIDEKSIDWIISRGLELEFSNTKDHVKESGQKLKKYFGIFRKI